jgi:xanthine/uracil permease
MTGTQVEPLTGRQWGIVAATVAMLAGVPVAVGLLVSPWGAGAAAVWLYGLIAWAGITEWAVGKGRAAAAYISAIVLAFGVIPLGLLLLDSPWH